MSYRESDLVSFSATDRCLSGVRISSDDGDIVARKAGHTGPGDGGRVRQCHALPEDPEAMNELNPRYIYQAWMALVITKPHQNRG